MVKTIVADKIIEQLVAYGIRRIYGIPGDSNLPLMESIRKNKKIKFILTRHEETAAFMASAYAKLTDNIGVCLATGGPGCTNLITGLLDAATDGAPVLALLGQVPETYLGSEAFQEIDQIEIFKPFSVFAEIIGKADQTIEITNMAIKEAYSKRGVSVLSLPKDVLTENLEEKIWKPEEHLFKQEIISKKELNNAIQIINKSKKPVIFTGWGARNSKKELLKLAEKLNAPIVTTSRVKGIIDESHSLSIGVLGSIGNQFAPQLLKEADLLIILGSGFRQKHLVPDMDIIQVDIDPLKIGKTFSVKSGIVGDAKLVINEFLKKVNKKQFDKNFQKTLRKLKNDFRKDIKESIKSDVAQSIHPGFIIQSLQRNIRKDAIICVDVGDHTFWFFKKFVSRGQKIFISANMASMAFALPAALSSQIENPTKQVICITGDGGFAMLMADFTTAVFNNLPIKVILFNDKKLKNIKKEQEAKGYQEFGVDFINPNFAEYANNCGGFGINVEDPKDLDKAIKKALLIKKPALVDISVDPNTYFRNKKNLK